MDEATTNTSGPMRGALDSITAPVEGLSPAHVGSAS
jgi:hypothetical protein